MKKFTMLCLFILGVVSMNAQNFGSGMSTIHQGEIPTNLNSTTTNLPHVANVVSQQGFMPANSVLFLNSTCTVAWATEVELALEAQGIPVVDLFNVGTSLPTLALLNMYDAVLVTTDCGVFDQAGTVTVLDQYIDGGGAVIDTAFSFDNSFGLGAAWNANYGLLDSPAFTSGIVRTLGTVNVPGHPIMAGVTSYNGGSSSYNYVATAKAGATVVADYDNGNPFIIVQENVGPSNVRRASINMYTPSNVSRGDFWDATTDGYVILANALNWVANTVVGAPPTIACPADLVVDSSPGECGAVVSVAAVASDPEDGVIPALQTGGPMSGTLFPVGVSTVEFTATDSDGNSVSCTMTVTVNDVEAPMLECPADIVVANDPGICGAVVTFDDPIITDNCPPATSGGGPIANAIPGLVLDPSVGSVQMGIAYNPMEDRYYAASGNASTNPIECFDGTTGAVINSTMPGFDQRGIWWNPNTNQAEGNGWNTSGVFSITATGACPDGGSTMLFPANQPNSQSKGDYDFDLDEIVYYDAGAITKVNRADNTTVGVLTLTGSPAGSNYAQFAIGYTGVAGFEYSLYDNTTLSVHFFDLTGAFSGESLVGLALGNSSFTYSYENGLAWIFDGTNWNSFTVANQAGLVQTAGLPSGSEFPVGTTTNTFVYTDGGGNSATCSFTVTVEDTEAPVIMCIGEPLDTDVMVNGSFETGDFSGWTVEDFTNPFLPYSVVPSFDPGFGLGEALPTDGGFLAANGFDAGDPEEALLYQDVTIPAGATATLTWDENIDYDMMSFCAGCLDRLYEVQVRDLAGNVLETVQTVIGVGGTIEADNAWESLSADLTAYAGQDVRITFWQNIPEAFTGPGKFALDNVVLQVTAVSSPPFSVDLDANGMATINVADLLTATDNCGSVVSTVGDAPVAGSLPTLFDGGNGQSGNMFDINALENVTIDSFDVHLVAGTTDDIEVYFKAGTFVGSEADPSAWTLLATAAGITSAGDNTPTPLGLSLGQTIAAGDTGAFYVTTTLGGTMAYTNGTTQGAIFSSDANIEFLEGDGVVYPFAGNFSPRVFNGNILYTVGDGPMTTLDVDCSNLGINEVEVTVTDDAGNISTCTASFEVFDVTDPILICMDVTIELGPDGTAEVDPAALLAVAPSTFDAMVIGSDNQSGTAGTTDFTVDVTAAETVSFDWMYTSNDDPGFDSFGYVLNGTYTQLTDNAIGNQMGSASVAVAPGDVFGFRSVTDDNGFGNNETLITNFLPGFDGQFEPANWTVTLDNSDGDAFFIEIPGGPLSFDACGITVLAVDVTDVSCADIGTPITAMVFASDASGNIAACNSIITVVDALAPEVTCPADQTIDPGPGNLFYEVPDYFATGEATAIDNCTDPLTILSQSPAAGDLIPDGVYTVTITAEDEYGNVGECTFELTIESVLGLDDNVLDSSITMFPNPANASVTLSNTSNIALEKAAIYDTNGRLINTIDLSTMQQEKVIDVSALATGVYMVQIQSENASTVKRLVKE